MTDDLFPKDHTAALALLRAQAIGSLLCRDRGQYGEASESLRQLAAQPVRSPGAAVSRRYAASTLERWYHMLKNHGLDGLRSASRSEGHALTLTDEQREFLLSVRRDHTRA